MALSSSELKAAEPVDAILARVVQTVPGWTPFEQLLALYSAVAFNSLADGDVIELGAWCGRSTVALGLAARVVGCHVHTVDIFPEKGDWRQNEDGSWSIHTQIDGRSVSGCLTHTVWNEAFQRDVAPVYAAGSSPRARLDQALLDFGLDGTITVHRNTADEFVKKFGGKLTARLIFLDGDHSEDTVAADLDALLPLLGPGSLLCLDDAFTSYDGVDRAIINALERNGQSFDEPVRVTRKMAAVRRRSNPGLLAR